MQEIEPVSSAELTRKLKASKRAKYIRVGVFLLIAIPLLGIPLLSEVSKKAATVMGLIGLALIYYLQARSFFPMRRRKSLEQLDEEEFLAWAQGEGLETTPTDFDLIELLKPLGIFGKYRPLFIGVRGERLGQPFWIGRLTIFDDGVGGDSRVLLDDMLAVYRLPFHFRHQLLIEPKSGKHTLMRELFNMPVVNFESHAFNEAYAATSDDPRFAHACVTPLVMEELLKWPNIEILLRSGILLVNATDSGWLSRDGAKRLRGVAEAFLRAFPDYLKETDL